MKNKKLIFLFTFLLLTVIFFGKSPNQAFGQTAGYNINILGQNPTSGQFLSLEMDDNPLYNFPIVSSLTGTTSKNLAADVCENTDCSNAFPGNPGGTSGAQGYTTSLAMDKNGWPVIAFVKNEPATELHIQIRRCYSKRCTGPEPTVIDPDPIHTKALITSLELDFSSACSDPILGCPMIVYGAWETNPTGTVFIRCNDPNCGGGDDNIKQIDLIPPGYDRGVDIELDKNGYPVIAFYPWGGSPKIVRCKDRDCNNYTIYSLPNHPGGMYGFLDLELDFTSSGCKTFGCPVIIVASGGTDREAFLRCSKPDCSSNTGWIGGFEPGKVILYPSLELTTAGLPVISYQNLTDEKLIMVRCFTLDCASAYRKSKELDTKGTTGVFTGNYQDLGLNRENNPYIAFQANNPGSGDKERLMILACAHENCGSAATLNVMVFNDKDRDGRYDPGVEDFTDFDPISAQVQLSDGRTISPKADGTASLIVDASPSSYNVSIDPNIGWEVTGCEIDGVPCTSTMIPNPNTYPDCRGGYCATENFQIVENQFKKVNLGIIQTSPPSADTLKATVSSECSPSPLSARFTWVFSDSGGGSQSAYQVQVDDDAVLSDCSTDVTCWDSCHNNLGWDTCSTGGSSKSYTPPAGVIQYNGPAKPYYWRLRVWDSPSNPSDWLYPPSPSFITPLHVLPLVEFDYSPEHPSAGQPVTFTDHSKCYRASPPNQEYDCKDNISNHYLWNFDDTSSNCDSDTNPSCRDAGAVTHSFLPPIKNYKVKLFISDDLGPSLIQDACSRMKEVPVGLLPEWKEITPTGRANQFLASVFNYLKPLNFFLK